jgi:hypothetical protein
LPSPAAQLINSLSFNKNEFPDVALNSDQIAPPSPLALQFENTQLLINNEPNAYTHPPFDEVHPVKSVSLTSAHDPYNNKQQYQQQQ